MGEETYREDTDRIIGYFILGSVLLLGIGWTIHFLLTKEVSPSSPVRLWGEAVVNIPLNLPKYVGVLAGFLVGPIAYMFFSESSDEDKQFRLLVGLYLGVMVGLGLALGFELAQSWMTILTIIILLVVSSLTLRRLVKRFSLSRNTDKNLGVIAIIIASMISLLLAWQFRFVPSLITTPLGLVVAFIVGYALKVTVEDQLPLLIGLFFGVQLVAIIGLGLLSGAISGLLVLVPFVIGWSSCFVVLALARDIKKLFSLIYQSISKRVSLTYSK